LLPRPADLAQHQMAGVAVDLVGGEGLHHWESDVALRAPKRKLCDISCDVIPQR
jgi:hypothetical protein